MAIFDFLSSDKRRKRRLEREIKSANNKFKPKDYRQISLQNVIVEARAGNETAIHGLIKRFAVVAEPTIEDEKEKSWVYDALVDIGDKAVPALQRALRSSESITWVQRTLKHIVSPEEYRAEMLAVLADFDTEYERNPDRKLQTIMALSEISDEQVTEALIRFLDDVDETVRYQTVTALATQGVASTREALLRTMCEDESIRVRNAVIEAFSRLDWLTTGYKKKVEAILPGGYRMDKSGKILKLKSQG